MRVYLRGPIYYVAFTLPGAPAETVVSTRQREKRRAEAVADTILARHMAELQRTTRTESSTSGLRFETTAEVARFRTEGVRPGDAGAVARWLRARIHQTTRAGRPLAPATLELDGRNLVYLAQARGGDGRSFFAGELVQGVTGETIAAYIVACKAAGLLVETISKRLGTLRMVLQHAHTTPGPDGRPLLGLLPLIPNLGTSRDADGWGRALTREEWAALRMALPTTLAAKRSVWQAPKGRTWYGSADGRPVNLLSDGEAAQLEPDAARALALERVQCLPRGRRSVDQRGWSEICLLTAQHPSDVNDMCPERIGGHPGSLPGLKPGQYMWRNTKSKGHKVRQRPKWMCRDLCEVVERLRAERGWADGVPLAGFWTNPHRDLNIAARRSGLAPVTDDRGRTHLVSASDLRRTAATWLGETLAETGSGPDRSAIEIIADFLGHKGIDVARRIYDRSAGARDRIAADAFDRMRDSERRPPRPLGEPTPLPLRKRDKGEG